MELKRSAVIMAGGRGERFWPQSRLRRPKHLLPVVGETPMLRQTIDRLDGLVPAERVWVITNSEQVDAVREICPEIPAEQIVAEPVGRDTAPAVALAALLVEQNSGDHAFAMLPADHVIGNTEAFRADLLAGFDAAEKDPVIATIGITPTFPATGYGYIQSKASDTTKALPVERFVEKPDLPTAESYLSNGGFYWNAGIFIWRPSTILGAIENHCPALHESFSSIRNALAAGEPLSAILPREYPQLEKISIDYAVMEKAENVVMVQSTFDWDDVGSWPAIERHHPKNDDGNIFKGTVVSEQSANNLVLTEGGHLIGLVGVEDLMVIHTPDATLICPKDRAQDVKKLVKQVEALKDGKSYL
tara:strand:+ start:137 stop:1216 length:1080 start_codon:yes stop_codon:yes gene_type:complete